MFRRSNPNIAVQELPKPWDLDMVGDSFEPEIPNPRTLRRIRHHTGRFIDWYFRVSANGIEGISPEGPDVYASNHRNRLFDVPLTGVVFWGKRAPFYPTKDELDRPFLGRMLKDCGALFFDRDDSESSAEVIGRAGTEVAAGHAANFYIEGTSRNRGRELGAFQSSAPVMLAVENGLDAITLIGIGGTEGTFSTWFRRKFHVEVGKLSLEGLKTVIETVRENKALNRERTPDEKQKITATDISRMLAKQYGHKELSEDELTKILNPDKKRGHQRSKKPIDAENTESTRAHIYEIFSEQILRPALQEVVNISYVKAGVADPGVVEARLAA